MVKNPFKDYENVICIEQKVWIYRSNRFRINYCWNFCCTWIYRND